MIKQMFKQRYGYLSLLFALVMFPSHVRANQDQVPAQRSFPKLQVYIVGVPSWKVSEYSQSQLGGNIQDACLAIEDFFENKFGGEVEIHPDKDVRCTEKATTFDEIRKLLLEDLPARAKDTLTFLFMMSHGEIAKYDNDYRHEDVKFLTSDATDETKTTKSVLIDTDLISWLSNLSAGSTVLVFIDTCNAGAVNSLDLQLQTGAKDFLGLRLGVMVSSLNNKGTYAAAFTRSLIDFWKSPSCPAPTPKLKVEDWLHNEIEQIVGPLAAFDGKPETVIPFAGSLCLGQLGEPGRLLFLYQGMTKHVIWNITDLDNPAKLLAPIDTSTDAYTFSLVPPGRYKLSAMTPDGKVLDFGPYDLVKDATLPVFYSYPNSRDEANRVMKAWLEHAKFKGFADADIAKVAAKANYVETALAMSREVNGTDKSEITAAMREVRSDAEKLDDLGNTLLKNGDYQAAEHAFTKAAQSYSDDTAARESAATDAFLAAGVAGDVKGANNIRKHYELESSSSVNQITESVSRAEKDKDKDTLEHLAVASAIELAGKHAETSDREAQPPEQMRFDLNNPPGKR